MNPQVSCGYVCRGGERRQVLHTTLLTALLLGECVNGARVRVYARGQEKKGKLSFRSRVV